MHTHTERERERLRSIHAEQTRDLLVLLEASEFLCKNLGKPPPGLRRESYAADFVSILYLRRERWSRGRSRWKAGSPKLSLIPFNA